jgi:hypothetical protein
MPDIWGGLAAATDAAILDNLGITVSYKRGAAAPVQITAIFDGDYVPVDTGRSEIAAQGPMIFIRLSSLTSDPARGDEVTVNGVLYAVESVHKDGEGAAELMLILK